MDFTSTSALKNIDLRLFGMFPPMIGKEKRQGCAKVGTASAGRRDGP